MQQAESENTRTTSRRSVIKGGLIAGLVAAASVPIATSSDDELIIALGKENERLYARLNDDGMTDALADRLFQRIREVEKRIAALPASTFAALAVKLRMASDNLPDPEDQYGDHRALVSALADCERLAKGA